MKQFAAAVVGLALLCGCQAVKQSSARFGKDLLILATSPAHIPCAAVNDVCGGKPPEGPHPLTTPLLIPLNFLKHAYFTLAYGVDAMLYPFYLPFGLEPWDLYTIDGFPYSVNRAREEVLLDPLSFYE